MLLTLMEEKEKLPVAGKIVWMDLDARTARDFGGANVVKNYRAHYGDAPVDDKNKTFFTFDLVTPANNIPYAINQQICRDWSKEQGVKVFDVDMGIGMIVPALQASAFCPSRSVPPGCERCWSRCVARVRVQTGGVDSASGGSTARLPSARTAWVRE